MSTCNIKIYRTQLTPSRNALVDELERYLGGLIPLYSNPSFQYQQLGLDLTIKVNVTQSKITESSIGNYVRIEQDDRIWYYFILGAQWKGKKVVQLILSIDSINTFRNDLHWTDKTTIMRQHGDRFFRQYNNEFIRRIDEEGEGVTAEKYLVSSSDVRDETIGEDIQWYLMYKTRDALSPNDYANPIGCYLLADRPIQISTGASGSVTITTDNLIEGTYYYFNYVDNPGGSVTINGNTYTLGNTYKLKTTTESNWYDRILQGIVITKYDGSIRYGLQWNDVTYSWTGIEITTSSFHTFTAPGYLANTNYVYSSRSISTSIPLSRDSISDVVVITGQKWRVSSTMYSITEQSLISQNFYYTVAGQPATVVNSLASIDRTESRIMKILALPYAPCEIVKIGENYSFPDEWVFEGGYLRLNDLSTEFSNYIGRIGLSQLDPGAIIPDHSHDREAPQDQRDNRRESKLFHSDYYTYKAVYDSFAKEVQLERIKPFLERGVYEDNEVYIPVYFKPTNTINSKMAFKFDTKHLTSYADFAKYEQMEDYGDYLIVARNNEIPIYSNDYVNYIRNGYNYDLKAQELSKQQAIANMVVEGFSTAASLGFGKWTQSKKDWASARQLYEREFTSMMGSDYASPEEVVATGAYKSVKDMLTPEYNRVKAQGGTNPLYAVQGISTGTGLIKSAVNLYFSQAQATNERNAKLSSLAAQSTAVAGSDDIDLLNYYNGNQLQLFTYDTKNYQKDAIADLFHYCGYTHAHMEYPDITSRIWFNFIQCEPFFREEPYTPFNNYLEDIKARYSTGVTVYHCNNGQWDWDQEYENWEVMIYPEQSYISNDAIQGFKCTELTGGRYRITFDYLGKQYLNGGASGDDNFIEIEMINMYDEVVYPRRLAASTGQHITITTGDFYEAPTKVRYRITYLDKETEWQTVTLAGG